MPRDATKTLLAVLALSLTPQAALAWDGFHNWYSPASGSSDADPGGGGIIGTGGAQDFGITCANCHVESEGLIALRLTFSPPLESLGGNEGYVPGQTYSVTATLSGEHRGLDGCGQYVSHTNGFAAAFEDVSGTNTGTLVSDSGQRSDACPALDSLRDGSGAWQRPVGTTMVVESCHAVISLETGDQNPRTSWQFQWIAPPAGTGEVTVHYGAVDGDCVMDSFNDDVQTGSIPLQEASTARTPKPRRGLGGGHDWGLLVALALVGVWTRRTG